jgi:hypothetical protein
MLICKQADAGRGDVPLARLRFRCSNCSSEGDCRRTVAEMAPYGWRAKTLFGWNPHSTPHHPLHS